MSLWEKIITGIKNPMMALWVILPGKFWSAWSDTAYLRFLFRARTGRKLNLEDPKGFHEKLQWLKLYDRRPEYTMMADKVAVRAYIAEKLGEEYLIPLLGVWNDPEQIDFESLPEQFVLKCNHNSGLGMCICKKKSELDIEKVKRDLARGLKENYYLSGREWPYKNIQRKIIAEAFMVDSTAEELRDYKWYCFNGVPEFCQVISDRSKCETIDFFNPSWEHMEFTGLSEPGNPYPKSKDPVAAPHTLEQMKEAASILSQGIAFARIDLYEVNGKMYFGEITFFPASGLGVFEPEQWNYYLGDRIVLPKQKRREE